MQAINRLPAAAVVVAAAETDAVYVMFTSAVVARRRVPAATWSSVWYLLSSFAVISYTENWVYVGFAAVGSWLGAFASITLLHPPPGGPPAGAAPEQRNIIAKIRRGRKGASRRAHHFSTASSRMGGTLCLCLPS